MSDNHNLYPKTLGQGEILFHTGDATGHGSEKELERLKVFFESQLNYFDHIVYIPGNHDMMFEKEEARARGMFPSSRIHILIHQALELYGFKIYGNPVTRLYKPKHRAEPWAFNAPEQQLYKFFEKIPLDTEILLTHMPPYGILDYAPMTGHLGSQALMYHIENNLKDLKLHGFGHIHESYGVKEKNGILFSNAAMAGSIDRGPFTAIEILWDDKKIIDINPLKEEL